MKNQNKFSNEKITGIIQDVFISILIAIPFGFVDYRAALSSGAICIVILLSRRLM